MCMFVLLFRLVTRLYLVSDSLLKVTVFSLRVINFVTDKVNSSIILALINTLNILILLCLNFFFFKLRPKCFNNFTTLLLC